MEKENSATIDLLPKQTEAWDLFEDKTTTEVGYGGAAGGGKTRLGWYIAIYVAEAYPGSRCAVARKELKTLRLTSLAELFIIFVELGYKKDVDYKYRESDGIIKFANGSEILLLDTARDPQDPEYTRFGSLNLTWAWCEESNETPEKARDILNTRVGRHNKFVIDGKQIIAKEFWLETFNPNKGHVYRNYYKPWKEKRMPSHRAFIRALPGDNPHLPEAYIRKLRNSPDRTIRERLLKGNFDYDADPMKLMTYDAITDLRTNTVPIGKKVKFLINDIARYGGDKIVLAEFEDYTLVGLGVYRYQGLDETEQKIKDQAAESKIPFSQILSDDDGVGGSVADHLRGTKGFNGNARALEKTNSFTGKLEAQNFSNLRSQCYFKLGDLVNEHAMAIQLRYFKTNVEVFNDEGEPMALGEREALQMIEEELDAVKRVPQETQNAKQAIIPKADMKEDLGRSPDFSDVFMMRMMFEFKPPALAGGKQQKEEDPFLRQIAKQRAKKIVINRGK